MLHDKQIINFRTLSHEEMLAHCAAQPRLNPLELELFLRLEQLMNARDHVIEVMMTTDCATCPNAVNLIPPADLVGQVSIVPVEDTAWQ